MKQFSLLTPLVTLGIFLLPFFDTHPATCIPDKPANKFSSEMATIMKSMKTYTLAVADTMPEKYYDYRPTPGVRTFAEQMKHLTVTMKTQSGYFLHNRPITLREIINLLSEYEKKPLNKKQIMEDMSEAFDLTITTLENMNPDELDMTYDLHIPGIPAKPLSVWAMGMRDHISHTRAQAIMYLRAKGIVPPQYTPF